MAFPPNYRQNRQDRARAKDKKAREKEERREERKKRKPDHSSERSLVNETKTDGDKE